MITIFPVLAFLCTSATVNAFFDPISIGLATGAALGWYNFDTIKCQFQECCNHENIPANIYSLENDISKNVFGQHILEQQLMAALKAHYTYGKKSRKSLVISFHGTPGTGKNFVADKIASNIYKNGLESRFVHKFMGRADFPLESHAEIYSAGIVSKVRNAIRICPRSLFIFDEVDKIPEKTFEALKSFLNYNLRYFGEDYSQAMFIFLSNSGGVQIADTLGTLLNQGTLREQTKLSHFEKILESTAYQQEGGLKNSGLIEAHIIDHYIPFLPLEKSHVRKCVEAEFKKWNVKPKEDSVELIVNEAVVYDRKYGIFATSGCKKLEKKVAVEAHYRY